jgi:hydrogenase nickel incorporation protein HypB
MCTTCGCGKGETRLDGSVMDDRRTRDHLAEQDHQIRYHGHVQPASLLQSRPAPAYVHAPGLSAARRVRIEKDLLALNDAHADRNRRYFGAHRIFALNLVSSPGSGKTTLLTRTIEALRGRLPVGVIEGDQQTSRDAERIRATGARAVQINTGKGCHLDAHMVGRALGRLAPADGSVVMIENVGNLVCPAAFDLGEAHKVVVLSVTEGEDKPLKYPDMFHAACVMLLNKVDLLPYVQFDVARCIDYARKVKPGIRVMQVSATRGDGMGEWLAWIEDGARAARQSPLEHTAGVGRQADQVVDLSDVVPAIAGTRPGQPPLDPRRRGDDS